MGSNYFDDWQNTSEENESTKSLKNNILDLNFQRIDKEFFKSCPSKSIDIAVLEKDIFLEVGEAFNLASPKQLGAILFEKLKLEDKPKKTKTGQYSTAEDILSYLAKDHSIVAKIL